ncbi:MAG: type VI secretion system contractile sheath large subunit [Hyphomicrobiales bacterium]
MAEETIGAALQSPEVETSDQEKVTLLDAIVEETSLRPDDDGFAVARAGLRTLMRELVRPERDGAKVNGLLVDELIADLDAQVSAQMDEILHDKQFQTLESSWRALKFLVERTDFRENIKIEIMNVGKEDLLEDFEDAPELTKSGLYKQIYTAEYGQFGGQPVGALIANYDFGPGSRDVKLLTHVAGVAAMAHTPFISALAPEFLGLSEWAGLTNLKDLSSIFEQPRYAKWRSFRESEDSRYVALAMPKFLLRLPYGQETNPTKTFNYSETVSDGVEHFCWGNAAFALASRLTDSFAKYRWCANIIGPQGGGAVEDLPLHHFTATGSAQTKIPTQVLVSERREYELSEEGFIALTVRKGSDNAAFFSANSCQKAKTFPDTPEGREAQTNFRLSTQLPYMLIMNRLAHYIKIIQRENIGTSKERGDLEDELNKWVSQYVTEMDNPEPSVRSRRPLRAANIAISDEDGNPGWYQVELKARPHFKYMGASFTLSLVGRLDKD